MHKHYVAIIVDIYVSFSGTFISTLHLLDGQQSEAHPFP